jgi:hypothetical protein
MGNSDAHVKLMRHAAKVFTRHRRKDPRVLHEVAGARRFGSLSSRWNHSSPNLCIHCGARFLVPDAKSNAAPTHRITGAAPKSRNRLATLMLVGRADADPQQLRPRRSDLCRGGGEIALARHTHGR